MNTKKLLEEVINYLREKYRDENISFAEQVDGILMSAVSIAMQGKGEPQVYKIVIRDMQRKIEG